MEEKHDQYARRLGLLLTPDDHITDTTLIKLVLTLASEYDRGKRDKTEHIEKAFRYLADELREELKIMDMRLQVDGDKLQHAQQHDMIRFFLRRIEVAKLIAYEKSPDTLKGGSEDE